MGHATTAAATRRPQLEVPDAVGRESDFWKFVGAVAMPMASVALFALVVGLAPRLLLPHDPTLSVQPSAGASPVFDIPRERLRAVSRGALDDDPTLPEAPTEQSPAPPFPVVPPFIVPGERPPPATVERDAPPDRSEPAPAPALADRAQPLPPDLERPAPAAGPSDPPRDTAALSRVEPPPPEPPTPGPSIEARPSDLPAPPEPTLPAPLETQPSPAPSVSSEPEPPVEIEREPPPEPAVAALPPAPPEPTLPAPVEIQPSPAPSVLPEPRPSVDVAPELPPAEVAPEPPPAGLPTTPAAPSEAPAAETPQVASIPTGPAAVLDQLLPPGRGSGHKLLARLAATASSEGCDGRQLPYFRVVESNVLPARVPPGGRFSHRLVYALCPADQAARATATVTRELRGSTAVVLTEETAGFGLRPGTWASDEELTVPPTATPGRYTVTTTVAFGGRVWTEETVLLIE